jgi:hypothetical protein
MRRQSKLSKYGLQLDTGHWHIWKEVEDMLWNMIILLFTKFMFGVVKICYFELLICGVCSYV